MTSRKEYRKTNIIDSFTNTVPFLPEEHLLVHAAKLWDVQYVGASVASASSIEMFIRTSNTRQLLHMLFTFQSSLLADFYIYEGTSKTYASGNALTSYNRNRYESNPLKAAPQICHTPAGSGDGTLLFQGILGGGAGPRNFGGEGRDANEILLAPNTAYLLRLTSRAASNRLQINAEYYERFHDDAATTTTTTSTTTTTTV